MANALILSYSYIILSLAGQTAIFFYVGVSLVPLR